jgi:hypothetical protein
MKELLNPSTQEELNRNVRRTINNILIYIAIMGGFFLLAQIVNGNYLPTIFMMMFIASIVIAMVVCIPIWSISLDSRKPINGEGCKKLYRLTNEHPEIKKFILQINNMGRPVVWDDLWHVNAWIDTCEEDVTDQECRQLNGIA